MPGFITESRAQLGYLPLQHHDYEKAVGGAQNLDQRESIWGVRIMDRRTDAADYGHLVPDLESYADIIGAFLWANKPGQRPTPAWR